MMQLRNIGAIFYFMLLLSCETTEMNHFSYNCIEDGSGTCVESVNGHFLNLEDCENYCDSNINNVETIVTVFLYENCPIAQYMCGPLRDAYRYFCDTLNQNIIFRGFSPNAFSTDESISDFIMKYDIPFNVTWDYNQLDNEPGSYTQQYLPVVTPEVFIEFNENLIYRGMIDNSYQSLGEWSMPTEHYLVNILTNIINGSDIEYSETQAIGCFINY